MGKMSEQEKNEWESLYKYVKEKIMCYDENQALPKDLVLRLKGLKTNKFIENKKVEDTANYSYLVILNTFKACYSSIMNGLSKGNFKDEKHKMNYIIKIVERNLNDVYLRMKRIEKTKEVVNNIDMSSAVNSNPVYTKKENTEKEIKNRYSDLW